MPIFKTSGSRKTASAVRETPFAYVPHGDLLTLRGDEHLWNINGAYWQDDGLVIDGWCLPIGGRLGETELVVNGVPHALPPAPFGAIYTELYPWYPNAAWSTFRLLVPHAVQDLRKASAINVRPRSRTTGQTSTYSLDFLLSDLTHEMPPAEIAARIGATNLADYVILGRRIYRGFDKAVKGCFGKSLSDYPTVLDWGCGSGRVARHVVAGLKPDQRFLGVDIDAVAVEWSNRSIGPYFQPCGTSPPLELPTASVDLVYAYSVFTHLAEADLRAWQKELARVVKPGGVVLFTVLSDWAMAALFPNPDRALLEGWLKRGIYDSIADSQLDTIDVAKDYYRNVWLTRPYIDQQFGSDFAIKEYVIGFHFYQSLVVGQRR